MVSLVSKRPFHAHAKKGFALIATLTLLLLLSLIAVAVLALAASQSRTASASMLAAEARSQALLGLDAALGELQLALGPDQRVSASSGIVGAHNANILGVWDSWDASLTDKSPAHGGDIQSTYTKGRDKMFNRWLISAKNKSDVLKMGGVGSLGTRLPGKRICLVGEGTLGRGIATQQYVFADLVETPISGKNIGNYAWWICGENQKAKINVDEPDETDNIMELQHRTWDTPRPIVSHIRGLENLPSDAESRKKFLTTGTLPLGRRSSADAGRPYFFDVTTSSYTLPVNVRSGRFKQDINLLLNKDSLKGTEFARLSSSDCGIFREDTIPKGTESDMPIGSWQIMHSWYHVWPGGGSSRAGSYGRSVSLMGTPQTPYTRLGGAEFNASGSQSFFDNKTDLEDGTNQAGYPRTPVILAFYNTLGLFVEELDTSGEEVVYKLSMSFAPMFLWWNPYNVPMKIQGDMLYSHSIPYKTMWLQSYAIQATNTWNYSWGTYAFAQGTSQYTLGYDYGNYFRKSTNNSSGDIEFEPGEIIFFSPAKARSSNEYTTPGDNPWTIGYHPEAVAGYKVHFYGNTNSTYGSTASNVNAGRFYLRVRLGIPDGSGRYTTDGYHFVPGTSSASTGALSALTLLNGYGGMTSYDTSSGSTGKMLQSPQRFLLGWYRPNEQPDNTVFIHESDGAVWQADSTQMSEDVPYFVGAVGLAAKTAATGLDHYMYGNKDFRTKSWQHSSPALWGSMIIDPDDQTRRYHPYQLSLLPVGTGMNMCPLDSTGEDGRNGYLGISSSYGGEEVSFASVLELPIHPPFSLAGFAGMRITPGWFDSGSDTKAALRRQQYQSGVQGVGIGNSFADPCIPANEVYQRNSLNIPQNSGGASKIFEDFFDHAFLINDALWDRFFCSSISDMPQSTGGSVKKAEDTLQEFLNGRSSLPVSRYRLADADISTDEIQRKVLSDDGWKHIARYLVIDGGFNINSTSVDAWRAVLQGLQNRTLIGRSGNSLAKIGDKSGSSDSPSNVFFSRFGTSTTTKSIDSMGGYSPITGANFRNSNMAAAWGEVRELSPSQIRQLAEAIVEIVKKRGPFLNMADFINRRLDSSSEENSLVGALQAAIDNTSINTSIFNINTSSAPQGSLYKFAKADEGSIHTAAPGYLIQSDVLSSLGNILTVRDDTFIVRSYGSVRDKKGAVLSQAWCEATVQRCAEYVDSANEATDCKDELAGETRTGTKLTAINEAFGRRFKVVSFRWLSAADI